MEKNEILFFIYIFSLFFIHTIHSQEIECQGAVLRILNKTTNEKIFFTVPLSQTIELDNSTLVVHRCVKVENDGKRDDIALLMHKLNINLEDDESFFWLDF